MLVNTICMLLKRPRYKAQKLRAVFTSLFFCVFSSFFLLNSPIKSLFLHDRSTIVGLEFVKLFVKSRRVLPLKY